MVGGGNLPAVIAPNTCTETHSIDHGGFAIGGSSDRGSSAALSIRFKATSDTTPNMDCVTLVNGTQVKLADINSSMQTTVANAYAQANVSVATAGAAAQIQVAQVGGKAQTAVAAINAGNCELKAAAFVASFPEAADKLGGYDKLVKSCETPKPASRKNTGAATAKASTTVTLPVGTPLVTIINGSKCTDVCPERPAAQAAAATAPALKK